MIDNDTAQTLVRDFNMEPDTKYDELMNEEVAVVQDENNLHFSVDQMTEVADDVELIERDKQIPGGGTYPDLYRVKVGRDTQYYKVEFMEPVLQRLDKSVKDAFLFKESVDTVPAARAPIGDEWNFLVAPYRKSNE